MNDFCHESLAFFSNRFIDQNSFVTALLLLLLLLLLVLSLLLLLLYNSPQFRPTDLPSEHTRTNVCPFDTCSLTVQGVENAVQVLRNWLFGGGKFVALRVGLHGVNWYCRSAS